MRHREGVVLAPPPGGEATGEVMAEWHPPDPEATAKLLVPAREAMVELIMLVQGKIALGIARKGRRRGTEDGPAEAAVARESRRGHAARSANVTT